MKHLFFWVSLFLLFQQGIGLVNAQEIPAFFRVYDLTQTLSEQEKALLEQKIKHYEDSTSTQIAILMIKSLEGKKIEALSVEIAQSLGIGKKGKNNGVLILIAKADKKIRIRIEVGYGLEGALPDLEAKRIIEELMFPAIKKRNFYEALDKATDRIMVLSAGEFTPSETPTLSPLLIFMVLMFGLGISVIFLGIYFYKKRTGV